MKISCLLTQYKRNHLKEQLASVYNQTLKPDYVIVFQNENHVDISHLKNEYDFIHVKSDYNTKHFGRFTYCINLPVDICIIMDDDILPGKKCFESYVNQVISTNGIIGGNGRFLENSDRLKTVSFPDVGTRKLVEVDYIGHLWCFKKECLFNMFSIEPFTLETGEDMHLCFTNKIKNNISSYIGMQSQREEYSDTTLNSWADDQFSSYKRNNHGPLRSDIQKYFIKNYNLIGV